MQQALPPENPVFTSFDESLAAYSLPDRFTYPFDYEPHPLSLLAVEKLQVHLENQTDWEHNFGLTDQEGAVIGKMFGVLVVETPQNEIGYLSAFSGKLAGGNHHEKFVPPIFDGMASDGFLNAGMNELSSINERIRSLEEGASQTKQAQISLLKMERRTHSVALQNQIFDQYQFLNQAGKEKGLREIFEDVAYKNPPAGAGECAAPKLLQYAFKNDMKPLAMAEFWWGLSPKSNFWKHGHFYRSCIEKCAPILAHMLNGMDVESALNKEIA